MNISVSRGGAEIGEWSEEQVRSLYQEGKLLPTDHYWKEGMTEWAELSKMIKPPPPSPQKIIAALLSPIEQKPEKPKEGLDKIKKWNWSNPLYWIGAIGAIILGRMVGALFGYSAAYYPDIVKPMIAGGMLGFILCLIPACIAHYYYKTKYSNRYIWMPVTIGVMFGLLYGLIFSNGELTQTSNEINKTLPKMITNDLRLDSANVGPNKSLHYHYTIINPPPGVNSTLIETTLRPILIEDYRTKPDLKYFRDNRVTLSHDFYTENGTAIVTIEISPDDLK